MVDNVMANPKCWLKQKLLIFTPTTQLLKHDHKKHVAGKKDTEVFIITVLTENTYLHTYFNLVVCSLLLN